MASQLVQLVGALLVLAGYLLAQAAVWSPASYRYLLPNLLGSAVLGIDAVHEHQWGFVLLEGSWALVTAWSVVQKLRGRQPRAAPH